MSGNDQFALLPSPSRRDEHAEIDMAKLACASRRTC